MPQAMGGNYFLNIILIISLLAGERRRRCRRRRLCAWTLRLWTSLAAPTW